ncbi:MAG: AEC family transporter [Chitinophagales bacterium]|nr:AEC family transporter [Chitinophagales bacterium]
MLLIFVYLTVGRLLTTYKIVKPDFSARLNFIVINFCLSAVALLNIPELQFSNDLWMPISVAWIVYILAAVFFFVLQRLLHFDAATLGSLILCCGLFNSTFVGFPVIEALYGDEGLSIAIMTDQPGSFLVLSTLGVFTAAYFSSGNANFIPIAKKIFSFPPFWIFILSVVMLRLGLKVPQPIDIPLSVLASLLTPLALLSVGMQLDFSFDAALKTELLWGLVFKLFIAPTVIFISFYLLKKEVSLVMKVSVLQAAMAPMVSGSILAINHQLNPKLSNALIGIGIPLSFVTLAVWYVLLEFVF